MRFLNLKIIYSLDDIRVPTAKQVARDRLNNYLRAGKGNIRLHEYDPYQLQCRGKLASLVASAVLHYETLIKEKYYISRTDLISLLADGRNKELNDHIDCMGKIAHQDEEISPSNTVHEMIAAILRVSIDLGKPAVVARPRRDADILIRLGCPGAYRFAVNGAHMVTTHQSGIGPFVRECYKEAAEDSGQLFIAVHTPPKFSQLGLGLCST
jgi:hypothetical protein